MKKVILGVFILLAAVSVHAFDTTAFQIGIWAPRAQLVPEEINVSSLKLNLPYTSNDNITGLDLGFASSTKTASALQINLIMNRNQDTFGGIQVGIINLNGNSGGVIVGLWNVTDDKARGINVGLVNSSTEYRGLEVGIVNYTEVMCGLQIGIVNIITESTVPFCPILNFCF